MCVFLFKNRLFFLNLAWDRDVARNRMVFEIRAAKGKTTKCLHEKDYVSQGWYSNHIYMVSETHYCGVVIGIRSFYNPKNGCYNLNISIVLLHVTGRTLVIASNSCSFLLSALFFFLYSLLLFVGFVFDVICCIQKKSIWKSNWNVNNGESLE